MHKDKIFLEGSSAITVIADSRGVRYEGHWDVTILAPKNLSALTTASSVFTLLTWLTDHTGAVLHELNVGVSPDGTWSIAIEEVIENAE